MPLFGWPERPGLIFTERRRDMRRHAGEISFPGGRAEPGETLVECALREAREEIGLDPGAVEVVGALPPTSTVVTSFKVLPVVGLVPERLAHTLSPHEVERVIELDLDELRAGLRDAAADPPRRPVPDPDLRRRGGVHLGSDRADAPAVLRAPRRMSPPAHRRNPRFAAPGAVGFRHGCREAWVVRAGQGGTDLDAMGNDKRRSVIGQQYGASARKRLLVYGIAVAVIVLVVVAFLTV